MLSKQDFTDVFEGMWTTERLETLARIAVQGRQFENWWKFELATSLWELASSNNAKVFIEAHGRADIVVGSWADGPFGAELNPTGGLCVPIELKSSGTWWSNTKKAFEEPGQDRLAVDLCDLAKGARTNSPFALVGLLLTDANGNRKELDRFAQHALDLANSWKLQLVKRNDLPLPKLYTGHQPLASQLFWSN